MAEHQTVNNRELAAEITRLCRAGASGTVFLATGESHQARLVLQQGRIVCAHLGRDEGESAIRAIAALPSGQFAFNPELQLVSKMQPMPDTETLLQILQAGVIAADRVPPAQVEPATAGLPGNGEIVQVLIEESTEYLGPMALVICQEYLRQCPPTMTEMHIRQVVRQVQQDINDTDKAERFRASVFQRLGM